MRAESRGLPGPALDVPVDLDGDGLSTFGDRYVFNYWLELGGSLTRAMSSAEVGARGSTIDLSAFFRSGDADFASQPATVLAQATSQATASQSTSGGGAAASSGCPTLAEIVAPFNAGPAPTSVLASCHTRFALPTGADFDSWQGLWVSGGPTIPGAAGHPDSGVRLLDLSNSPPSGSDGTIPLVNPGITMSSGYRAEDIVVREDGSPVILDCPSGGGGAASAIHCLTTWPDSPGGNIICHTFRDAVPSAGVACGFCGIIHSPDPFAIDVVRPGMPVGFGLVNDFVFSDRALDPAGLLKDRIRTGHTPTGIPIPMTCAAQPDEILTTLYTFSTTKVWGIALGDFAGSGVFGAYFVAEPASGVRHIRRLRRGGLGGSFYYHEFFANLLPVGSPNSARSIEFDPISGDLFVSEEGAVDPPPGGGETARIWRIDSSGGTARLFGKLFNKPNGMAFHPSGVLLVVEDASDSESDQGNVLAIGGWRNNFKRGDANGDGTVDVSDPILIGNWVAEIGPEPACFDGADVNDDAWILQDDANELVNFLFGGGPAPPAPGPDNCGPDPTPDLLDCNLSLGAGCAIP